MAQTLRDRVIAFGQPSRIVGGLALILLALAGFLWLGGAEDGYDDSRPVPLIQADARPFKTVPEDRGGMDVPHQDSTVFNVLNSDTGNAPSVADAQVRVLKDEDFEDEDGQVSKARLFAGFNTTLAREDEESDPEPESLFPAKSSTGRADSGVPATIQKQGETVIVRADVPAAPEETDDLPVIGRGGTPEHSLKETKTALPVVPVTPPKKTPEPKPVASPRPVKSSTPKVAKSSANTAAKTEPSAGAATKAAAKAGQNYYVQVGSVKSLDGAKGEWKRLRAAFSDALGSSDVRYNRADLGARGVFFRIQAGPMSKDQAQAACDKIQSKKPGACLVARD